MADTTFGLNDRLLESLSVTSPQENNIFCWGLWERLSASILAAMTPLTQIMEFSREVVTNLRHDRLVATDRPPWATI